MKRVLMTGDTVGGVWTFTLELARGLGRHGVQVALATMGGPPSDTQRIEAASISNLRLYASQFKLEWMDDPWDDVEQAGAWLLGLEESFAPDVVHLNSFGHGTLRWSAPTVLTGHSCVMSWWAAVKGGPVPCLWDRYRHEVRRSLEAADFVTAPTQTMLDAVRANYCELPRSRAVLNGRSPSRFHQYAKEKFILSAGRLWDEAKNIRALAGIASRLPWPVYLAGDTGGASLPRCRTLGCLSSARLAEWYARASIYVLPAYYEPFGLSALEAALSGCALVLGDIPSLREVWGDSAVFVPPGDPHRLRAAISSLIRHPRVLQEQAKRSHQRALQLGADRMAEEYLAVYEQAGSRTKALCA